MKICGCELFVKIQTSINRVKPETQNLKMSYIANENQKVL